MTLSPAKTAILRQLLREPRGAEFLSSVLGRHVTVLRRHLQELIAGGFVEVRSGPSARGRPPAIYAITDDGRETFASGYGIVLNLLFQSMEERLPFTQVRAIVKGTAAHLARASGAPREMASALRRLREIGFKPELRTRKGEREMLSRSCPLLRVAREHTAIVCEAFHPALLSELLGEGGPFELRQTLARGDPYCIHRLGP